MSNDSLAPGEAVGARVISYPTVADFPSMNAMYRVRCVDQRGSEKWSEVCRNLVVDVGAQYMLDTGFNSGTAIAGTSWYMGLKDTSAAAATDTLASHSGWSELTPYSGNRPAWGQGSSSGTGTGNRQVTNGTAVSFTITSSATVGGIFICSAASGTTGTLFNATSFSASRAVNSGDTLLCTYTLSI